MARLVEISSVSHGEEIGDLIFIHGLDGDYQQTWRHPQNNDSWLEWLAKDHSDIRIFTLDYDISSLKFSRKNTQPLYERAKNILDLFALNEIGRRPFGLVCHSYGGLLAKQILRIACCSHSNEYRRVSEQLAFTVFLGTPHRGTGVATWIDRIGMHLTSTVVQELRSDSTTLRELNEWFRNYVTSKSLSVFSYSESKSTGGVIIVGIEDSDLGISSAPSIGLDEDHITIPKPQSKENQVYLRVSKLIHEKKKRSSSLKS